jgi:WD40 repeat protein
MRVYAWNAGHTKGVHCVAWSRLFRVLASGGADGRVTLWNPFSCRPLGALAGHAAPLVGLVDNEADMQLVSASEDGVVKVWDLRNQQCLQTLQLQQQQQQAASTTGCAASGAGSSKRRLSVLGWDPEHRVLVAGGASGISSWQQATAAAAAGCAARMRHAARAPASWVGFVPCVGEVVSTDSAATVCCWDLASGQLLHSFERAHGSCRISTATLDADCRRLITGAEDGSVKVWNLRTGTLLSSAGPSSGSSSGSGNSGSGNSSSSPAGALGAEVTGLAVCSSTAGNGQAAACIVATGWDRQVTWFADVPGRRRCPQLRAAAGPSSDVLAAAAMPGYPSLATACYNGEIWVWNLDSAAVRRKLAPPSLAHTPEHERAVEALAFLHADLRCACLCACALCLVAHSWWAPQFCVRPPRTQARARGRWRRRGAAFLGLLHRRLPGA